MLHPKVPASVRNAQQDHFKGSAVDIGAEHGGWFVLSKHCKCHPMLVGNGLKLKWGDHRAKESRKGWDTGLKEWSLSVLIKGRFSIQFKDKTYTLKRRGDFVVWRPGVSHTWRANSKSLILTVRWRARQKSKQVTRT